MKSSPPTPHSQIKTCNSFRRTLLRRSLHTFSAVAPVTHLDRMIYRRKVQKTRNSFRRSLLPLFVLVSPLGAHSYEKIGGAPSRAQEMMLSPFVMYHLRDFIKMPQKSPNVICHLQTLKSVSTCVMYHLQKTPGGVEMTGRKIGAKSFVALYLPHFFPVSPLLHHTYEKMGGACPLQGQEVFESALLLRLALAGEVI
jgi:hypothetical protein